MLVLLLDRFRAAVVWALTVAVGVEPLAGLFAEPLSDLFEWKILLKPSFGFACAVPVPTVMASAAAAVAIPAKPATFARFARPSVCAECRPTVRVLRHLLFAEVLPPCPRTTVLGMHKNGMTVLVN